MIELKVGAVGSSEGAATICSVRSINELNDIVGVEDAYGCRAKVRLTAFRLRAAFGQHVLYCRYIWLRPPNACACIL